MYKDIPRPNVMCGSTTNRKPRGWDKHDLAINDSGTVDRLYSGHTALESMTQTSTSLASESVLLVICGTIVIIINNKSLHVITDRRANVMQRTISPLLARYVDFCATCTGTHQL